MNRRVRFWPKHRIEKLPLVDEEGHLRGLITIKDIQKAQKYPNSAKDASGRLLCGAAVGVSHDVFDRIPALIAAAWISSASTLRMATASACSARSRKFVRRSRMFS